jgi:MFS family permease
LTPLQRRLGIALGLTQVLSWATTFYIPATMIGAASESLGQSKAVLLGGFSWSLLVSAACAPRVGRFIDRHGGRPVIAAGAVVTCAGLLALAAAPGVAGWYAAWTVLGLGMAMGLYDVAFSTIGRLLGRESRPAITGVTLLGGFASSVGWPTGTWLAHAFGWRVAVLLYAVLQVAVILPIVLAFVPRAPSQAPVAAADPREAAAPPAQGGAFLLLAVFFTTRSGLGALVSVHALVLLAGLGLTVDQAVLVASVIGPAQVGSRVVDYRFARGVSPVVSACFGAALLPLGVAAMLAGAPPLVFALGYGLSNGIYTISRGTLPMHVYGPHGYATLLGRLALPSLIAQAATPTLVAPLIEAWPASWVFAGIGALSLAAFCCLLPLRR